MSKPISRYVRLWAACILLGLMQPVLTIAANDTVRVMQSRGVDQSVRYADLTKFGPWDDRNYQLTAPDLQLLAKNEEQLHAQIPAFFRVELRKEWPHLKRTGAAQYPRAARQLFEIRYGGFMRNGKIENDRRELARVPVPVGDQVPMNDLLGAAEVTIEINPSDPDLAIAGSNNSGGQEMYYSTDGGLNWTVQGVLPNTCCDPTVDWSSDGTVAYVGALSGGAIGVSAWRSFDGGQTWVDRDDLTTGGSDKEFIHVDKSPSSPYQDNVYMTYHNGNTMQFGRVSGFVDGVPTTNFEFDIQAFPGAPSGIGSDITTTPNGDIYYIYGAFGTQTIEVLKSTDGGDNFTSMPVVDNTNGSFDFPIPAMESRRAWIYVAADTDNNGNVYASWTDTVDPENDGSATANHTRIYVARSSDGGASWDLSTPHSTADMNTVDRFNQWMTVDENGVVHVVYYDTRNSVNRTGVDLYYTFTTSGDSDWENGTVDWNEPERISSETSPNMTDFFEFGDYNGISVVGSKVLPVWTDNRTGVSNPDVYAADVVNITAEPAFTLSASPASQQVCAPGDLADITVSVGSLLEFVNPVTLSLDLPSGFSGGISTNPVTPAADPNTTTVSVSVGTITGGPNSFDINGSASGADDKSVTVNVDVYDDVPAAVSLDLPADNASGVGTSPTLSWAAQSDALEYTVELDDDPNFGSIDFTTTTTATSVVVDSGLATESTYYWRVRTSNTCGVGSDSDTFSFTTGAIICAVGPVSIPDGVSGGGAGTPVTLSLATSGGSITDLDVSILATHTWVGDLDFTLTHVDTGTSVVIIDRPGEPDGGTGTGCSNNNIDAVFDDDSSIPVENECATDPAITGTLAPQSPLSAFNGESLSGTWEMTVVDNYGIDTGSLDEWCLLPTTEAAVEDADDDGVSDAVDNCTNAPNPDQTDTDGDGFGNRCDADFDQSCAINFADLQLLSQVFFSTTDPLYDLDNDGAVNFADLQILSGLFFAEPGPSPATPCVAPSN